MGLSAFAAEAPLGDDGGKNQAEGDLDARLKRLSQDLGVNTPHQDSVSSAPDAKALDDMARARSAGFRVLGEFVAAIVAGLLIGFFIDKVAGTSPAFLIVFLILGTAAGFLNVYRVAAPRAGGPKQG